MSPIIFIFIDGVGVGKSSNKNNPFNSSINDLFIQDLNLGESRSTLRGGLYKAIDASLDFPGIPQSATGQSSMFSKVNTAKAIGEHLYAFPNKKLRSLLLKENILKSFIYQGKKAIFFNAYPGYDKTFGNKNRIKILEDGSIVSDLGPKIIRRISVTTTMALSIDQYFFSLDDLRKGHSIFHDITNESIVDKFDNLNLMTPTEAGNILFQCHGKYDFLLFEYYRSDNVGHSTKIDESQKVIAILSEFIKSIVNLLDLNHSTLVISSDHGNLEDISHGFHTTNPVPLMTWGKYSSLFNKEIYSLTDITKVITSVI